MFVVWQLKTFIEYTVARGPACKFLYTVLEKSYRATFRNTVRSIKDYVDAVYNTRGTVVPLPPVCPTVRLHDAQ
jgi:hypothetical protein